VKCTQKFKMKPNLKQLPKKSMENPKFRELEGKVVVVTGGAGILCGTLALSFANQGAKLAVLDLKKESAEQVAQQINRRGGDAIAVEVDVLSKESLLSACDVVTKTLGPCDILVNGAGGNHPLGTTTNPYLEKKDVLE